MRRVILNGHYYAVGLKWALLDGRTKAELIREAERYDEPYDVIALLKTQYALGRSQGKKVWKKSLSLAAVLGPAQYEDGVYVFPLEDADTHEAFWWVVGIHRGMISARTDRCFTMQEEAEAFARSVQDTLGVEKLITVSPDKGMTHLSETLAGLQKSHLKGARLSPLHQTTQTKLIKVFLGVCLFAAACWGVSSLLDYKERLDRAERSRIAAEKKHQRIRDVQDYPERHFPRQWMNAPDPGALVKQCVPAMFLHPLAANGWKLSALSCAGRSLSATWEQTEFSEYMLLPFNAVLDEKSPKFAMSHTPVPGNLPKGERALADLLSKEEAARRLYAFTQHFALKTKLSFKKRAVKKVEKIDVPCPWLEGSWELSEVPAYLVADYNSLAQALNIPGFILKEITFAKNTWKLKGEVYAK